MKQFEFKRVKWDPSNSEYHSVKHITQLLFQTSRFATPADVIAFVEKQYSCAILSYRVEVADMGIYD